MTERWGKCPRCRGRGSVAVETGVVEEGSGAKEVVLEECGTCDGSGHDGSAFAPDAPWLPQDGDGSR